MRNAASIRQIARSLTLSFLLLSTLVGCDQATKELAVSELADAPIVLVDGALDLTYAENYDVGFSLLRAIESDDVRRWVILGVGVVALGTLGVLLVQKPSIGLALLAAGALGNVTDRLFRGYVVDFIHVHHWPVFNVADACLVVGVVVTATLSTAWTSEPRPR